jgi:Bacterial capsule synthesis protein PGA_cap
MRTHALLTRLGITGLLTAAVLWGCGPGVGESPTNKTGYSVLFVGDTSFGENYQQEEKAAGGTDILAGKGYDWPLSRLKPLLSSSDLVIANLETPLTRRPKSNLQGIKKYLHWSDPEKATAALARHKIGVVSLANNHAMDYGTEGLKDTLLALEKHRIASYGAGLGDREAARPYRRKLRVGGLQVNLAVIGAFEYRTNYEQTYKFYAGGNLPGVHPLDTDRLPVQIERLKRTEPGLFVVVTPHWGRNYGWRREREEAAARRMIDAGADLVIGHGAHHFQAIERYKGRWILYNIGNFVFNSQGRYAEKKAHAASLAVQLRLRAEAGKLRWSLRCYPLLSDNLRTGYRPRLLSGREFESARGVLARRSPNPADWRRRAVAGRDAIGRYVELRGN